MSIAMKNKCAVHLLRMLIEVQNLFVGNLSWRLIIREIFLYRVADGISVNVALRQPCAKGFKNYSFQLETLDAPVVISCDYLPVPEFGKLRACCPP